MTETAKYLAVSVIQYCCFDLIRASNFVLRVSKLLALLPAAGLPERIVLRAARQARGGDDLESRAVGLVEVQAQREIEGGECLRAQGQARSTDVFARIEIPGAQR